MKYLLLLFAIAIIGCQSGQTDQFAVIKNYMKDTIVPKFNDPASYELVGIKLDTFYGKDYLSNLKQLYADSSIISKETFIEKQNEITNLSSIPNYQDSILYFRYKVEYRGKNKLGALVLNDLSILYNPYKKMVIEVDQ